MPRTEPDIARHSRAPGLSILIPVFNERETIRRVLSKVRSVNFPVETELIVVDDGSTDGSDEVLRNLPKWDNVRVFFKEDNEGKGSAIQTALRHVTNGCIQDQVILVRSRKIRSGSVRSVFRERKRCSEVV